MLSIDEAIAFERQQAKDKINEHYTFGIQKSKEAAEEHEQLAEWLEELKALREEKSDFQIKQIAKKPDRWESGYACCYSCKRGIVREDNYCCYCGQRIDWSNED